MSGKRNWLITGCSSGLGRALAKLLLQGEDNLVLTARDPATLTDLIAGQEHRAIALTLDVTSAEQVPNVVAQAERSFGPVDVLVNNAGYGHLGMVEDVPITDIYRLFETNLFGPIRLIKAVLPSMRLRRSGQIVNIASVGGLVGFPASGYYCATKFALVGLSESLRAEVAPLGIRVTVVEPGPFNTDFSSRSLAYTQPAATEYDIAASFERAGIADWAKLGADPTTGVAAMVEVLRSANPPLHLVLGRAGLDAVNAGMRARMAELEKWASVSALPG